MERTNTPTLTEMIQALAAQVMVAREVQQAGGDDGGWTDRRRRLFAKYNDVVNAYRAANINHVEVTR